MNLHWFDLTWDTPIRQIGWVWLMLGFGIGFLLYSSQQLWKEGLRIRTPLNKCEHLHTRCLHGDEITHRMKVYTFRFWKPDIIRRQACLDCGAALDRVAICSIFTDRHTWEGVWEGAD